MEGEAESQKDWRLTCPLPNKCLCSTQETEGAVTAKKVGKLTFPDSIENQYQFEAIARYFLGNLMACFQLNRIIELPLAIPLLNHILLFKKIILPLVFETMDKKCFVKECKSHSTAVVGLAFHALSIDKETAEKWRSRINCPKDVKSSIYFYAVFTSS